MSLRFRFGRYRIDLSVPIAWFVAVLLGGALAYGVLLTVAKLLSLFAPHIFLSLNALFSTTVAYLLPAAATMTAAIIFIPLLPFWRQKLPLPHDMEAFGHAIIPQAIVDALWLLLYCSVWGLLISRLPQSPRWQSAAFWIGILVVAVLELRQRATGARFSQSHAVAGRLRNFSTWLRDPGSCLYAIGGGVTVVAGVFIVWGTWSGFASPSASQENYIELVSAVLTASIAVVGIIVAIVAIGLQVLLERRTASLLRSVFQEPVVWASAAWVLASIIFGYYILWFGPNSDLAFAYFWVGVINLVILAVGVPYVAQSISFPKLVQRYGQQVASLVTRRFTDPMEAAMHLTDVRFWADLWIFGRFRLVPPAAQRARWIQERVAQSVLLLTEILRDGIRQDNRDTMQAALTSLTAIHAAYVPKLRYGTLQDDVIRVLDDGLTQAWKLALNEHADERVLDIFGEAIGKLCRDAATHVPTEPRIFAEIPYRWMCIAHDWLRDTIERGLMYPAAPMIILNAAEDTIVSLSESLVWESSVVLESLVEQYVRDTIPLITANIEGIYGAKLAGKCLSIGLAPGASLFQNIEAAPASAQRMLEEILDITGQAAPLAVVATYSSVSLREHIAGGLYGYRNALTARGTLLQDAVIAIAAMDNPPAEAADMLSKLIQFYAALQIPDGVPCGWLWEGALLSYGEAAGVAGAKIGTEAGTDDNAAQMLRQGLVEIAQASGKVAVLLVNSPSQTVMHLEDNFLVLPAIFLSYHDALEDPALLDGLRVYVDRLCNVISQLPDESHPRRRVLAVCRQVGAWYLGIVGMDVWLTELCDRLREYPPAPDRSPYASDRVNMGYPEFRRRGTWHFPWRYRWPGGHMRFQDWVTHTVTQASREEEFYDIVYHGRGDNERGPGEADRSPGYEPRSSRD